MIYNNYPDDYIVINAKWVEWDNDEQRWFFMTEDAFEKAQSLADYTKQVRKEVCERLDKTIEKYLCKKGKYRESLDISSIIKQVMKENLDQIQGK